MKGKTKALLTLRGRTFLERIGEAARPYARDVFVVGGEKETFRICSLRHVPDRWRDAGPLGGIASALSEAIDEQIFVVPCDAPLFDGRAIELARTAIGAAAAAVYQIDGRINGTFALYRKNSCLPVLREKLALGQLKLSDALEALHHVVISEDAWKGAGINPTAFWSVNTEVEYQQLLEKENGS